MSGEAHALDWVGDTLMYLIYILPKFRVMIHESEEVICEGLPLGCGVSA